MTCLSKYDAVDAVKIVVCVDGSASMTHGISFSYRKLAVILGDNFPQDSLNIYVFGERVHKSHKLSLEQLAEFNAGSMTYVDQITAALLEQGTPYRLLIIGDGVFSNEFEQVFKEIPFSKRGLMCSVSFLFVNNTGNSVSKAAQTVYNDVKKLVERNRDYGCLFGKLNVAPKIGFALPDEVVSTLLSKVPVSLTSDPTLYTVVNGGTVITWPKGKKNPLNELLVDHDDGDQILRILTVYVAECNIDPQALGEDHVLVVTYNAIKALTGYSNPLHNTAKSMLGCLSVKSNTNIRSVIQKNRESNLDDAIRDLRKAVKSDRTVPGLENPSPIQVIVNALKLGGNSSKIQVPYAPNMSQQQAEEALRIAAGLCKKELVLLIAAAILLGDRMDNGEPETRAAYVDLAMKTLSTGKLVNFDRVDPDLLHNRIVAGIVTFMMSRLDTRKLIATHSVLELAKVFAILKPVEVKVPLPLIQLSRQCRVPEGTVLVVFKRDSHPKDPYPNYPGLLKLVKTPPHLRYKLRDAYKHLEEILEYLDNPVPGEWDHMPEVSGVKTYYLVDPKTLMLLQVFLVECRRIDGENKSLDQNLMSARINTVRQIIADQAGEVSVTFNSEGAHLTGLPDSSVAFTKELEKELSDHVCQDLLGMDTTCPVCLVKDKDTRVCNNDHSLCGDCRNTIARMKKPQCPLCRENLLCE